MAHTLSVMINWKSISLSWSPMPFKLQKLLHTQEPPPTILILASGSFRNTAVTVFLNSIIVTSWWARWRLKSRKAGLFTQPLVQAQIKENIKAPRHWPLWGGFTGDRRISHTQRASNAENVSIWWRHHVISKHQSHRVFWKPIPQNYSWYCNRNSAWTGHFPDMRIPKYSHQKLWKRWRATWSF